MTPQSNFMVLAPIRPERQGELRAMLETMNGAPGMAEPANALFPFGRFPRLHVARFVILDDTTTGRSATGRSAARGPGLSGFSG